jgi:hypothetical protein
VKGWAKVLAYAYDVTVLMGNRPDNIQSIFSDYECFKKMSGLKLNADKRELFKMYSSNVARPPNSVIAGMVHCQHTVSDKN